MLLSKYETLLKEQKPLKTGKCVQKIIKKGSVISKTSLSSKPAIPKVFDVVQNPGTSEKTLNSGAVYALGVQQIGVGIK